MAEKPFESSSSSESSPILLTSSMDTTPLRKLLHGISGFVVSSSTCGKKTAATRGRRILHRDVEREEFQYGGGVGGGSGGGGGGGHCLSSYYSVFVARLAIMVSEHEHETLPCRSTV